MSTSENHHFQALAAQVGGHPGVMTSEDGSLVIKPVIPAEVEFYQMMQTNPVLEPLRPFVPKFYGTLRLEGQVDKDKSTDGGIVLKEGSDQKIGETEKDEYTASTTHDAPLHPVLPAAIYNP
jgi:inositol-polyphosphate multikinase